MSETNALAAKNIGSTIISNCDPLIQSNAIPLSERETRHHILAIAGSIRAGSSNRAVIEAAARIAPPGMSVLVYQDLARLPPFDPDCFDGDLPTIVRRLRQMVGAANALLICSPEYAHGITGVMKNALDWLVGSEDFSEKTVALVNISGRAHHADAQMREVLSTMNAVVSPKASRVFVVPSRALSRDEILGDPSLTEALREILLDLHCDLESRRSAALKGSVERCSLASMHRQDI